jgi:hypothetical protein
LVVTRRPRVLLSSSKRLVSPLFFCGPRRSHFWRIGLGIPNDSDPYNTDGDDGEADMWVVATAGRNRMPVTIMDL